MCLEDWATEVGIRKTTIFRRLQRGWSVEQALTTTAIRQAESGPGEKILTLNGKKRYLAEWARELGISPAAILHRIQSGWSVKRALTTPKPERPNAKLNMRQARAIRATYPGLSMEKIAGRYGVSKKTVLNIVHGRIFVEPASL
jgi:DNA-binding NarL/FixJ family response regulator